MNLALQWGADVIMAGFDMKATGGRKHWHPDHKGNNPNDGLFKGWIRAFRELYPRAWDRIKIHGNSAIDKYIRTPLVPPCEGVMAVLRSGGWCTSEYAERLAQSVEEQGIRCVTLTDMNPRCETIPLKHDWPGWWSKLEMCRPDIKGDWLCMDLDTLVLGDINPLMVQRPALLGEYYRKQLNSGVMYLTEPARKLVWRRWIRSPDKWMKEFRGDGEFIRDTIGHLCMDIRDVGGLHSYKVDGLKPDTRILIYHGQPRPHETRHW